MGSLVSSQIFMALLSCIGACPRALCFPGGSAGEEPAHSAGDLASIPGWGGSPREGNGYPLRYSGLENSTGCIVCGVSQSWTRPSDFHFQDICLGFLCPECPSFPPGDLPSFQALLTCPSPMSLSGSDEALPHPFRAEST